MQSPENTVKFFLSAYFATPYLVIIEIILVNLLHKHGLDWVLESPFKANCGKLLHEGIAHKQLPGG